jgi:hypothetical protein
MKITMTHRLHSAASRCTAFAASCGIFLLTGCEPEPRKVTPDMLHFPQTASGEAADEDLPRIEFSREEFVFDTIAIGEKVMHSFDFRNEGDAPLVIDQVRPSCGCTTLKDWPREPIGPGEGGTITVEFNSTGFPGPIEKTVQVSTNGVPRDFYLKLRGYVAGAEVAKTVKPAVEMERTR